MTKNTIETTTILDTAFIDTEAFRNIKKIPCLFAVDHVKHVTTTDINPKSAWVFTEAAVPTYKKDGTNVTVLHTGDVMIRRMVGAGKKPPAGYIEAELDPITGRSFGVEPVAASGFAKMFAEAAEGRTLAPGTYELCGPKLNGNPEKLNRHELLAHAAEVAVEIPDMTTIDPADAWTVLEPIFADFKARGVEGVVWAGADGKRAKLRTKDFFGDPNRR